MAGSLEGKDRTARMAGNKKSGKKGKGQEKEKLQIPFQSEIVLLLILAACIVMLLSNFGFGGFVGGKVSDLIFGLFGMMAYAFPICLFVGAAFFNFRKKSGAVIVKIAAGAIFVVFLCLFMELVAGGNASGYNIFKSFVFSVKSKSGGGAVGGLLASLLCPSIGKAGTYVVDVIALIISMVILTERSFLQGVQKGGRKVYETAREDVARYREERGNREWEERGSRKQEDSGRRKKRKRSSLMLDEEMGAIEVIGLPEADSQSKLPSAGGTAAHPVKSWMDKLAEEENLEARNREAEKELAGLDAIRQPVDARRRRQAEGLPDEEGPELIGRPASSQRGRQDEERSDEEGPGFIGRPAASRKGKRGGGQAERDGPELIGHPASSRRGRRQEGLPDEEGPELIGHPASSRGGWWEQGLLEQGGPKDSGRWASPMCEVEHSPRADQLVELEPIAAGKAEAEEKLHRDDNIEKDAESPEAVFRAGEEDGSTGSGEIETGDSIRIPNVVGFQDYRYPSADLLKKGKRSKGDSRQHLHETAMNLQQILKNFGVNVTITDVSCGPSVTRYELQPEVGVKVSKIVNLSDDIKLNLAAEDIRIEAPIPGKAAVGIEVPNKETMMVRFRELVESADFQNHPSGICFTVGKDIGGRPVVADIARMPHLLIAGATGSGKSVCINTIIMSILYKAHPEDVKLILIDPKVVELSVYNGIPHLMIPVVTDPKKAAGALHWAVSEMMSRYQKFSDCQVRDLKGYNKKAADGQNGEIQKMPQIVVVVDELADLMMVASKEVEDAICRLAQLARAAGIHLIIATQRPSVDVITGLIKANMPSRIAFAVSSSVDSRTILDMHGAEKLLGTGDMLFYPQGYPKPLRVQGPFVSDQEVEAVVDFLKDQSVAEYNEEVEEQVTAVSIGNSPGKAAPGGESERDSYFIEAGKFVVEKEKGSIGMLQRMFKIGFNRAARIMDQLEEAGVVGPEEGTKPRKILMTKEECEQFIKQGG